MQSAIEYAAIPTINLTPLFLVTNPLTNSSQSDTLQVKSTQSCKTNRLMLYVCLIKQTNSSDAKNCDEIYSYKLLTFNLDLQITNETPI